MTAGKSHRNVFFPLITLPFYVLFCCSWGAGVNIMQLVVVFLV